MRVTAVGTSGGVPTARYGTSCVSMELFGDRFLLDCGEGSSQRLMRHASVNVDSILISHFYADHTLGLPGVIQALEMDDRDRQLDVHVPAGRYDRAVDLIEGAYGEPSYPVEIHTYTSDEPAVETDEYSVTPFATPYTDYSHGFVVQEAAKREFDPERAQELGISPGPKYGQLQAVQSVETPDGETVQPDDVLSEPQPGRKLVYTGDTRPTQAVVDAAADASLVIYSAMFSEDLAGHARSTGHSTAREAGEVATEANADRLWLTHISPRHEGDEEQLVTQAASAFDGDVVAVRDGDTTGITRSR
ncbi:ribonuclease [Halobaculum sp. MBLA0147]|uniref:ribonuclease n=1 Tax=Halobaculum sp. MBLA0147 TaxID=3079934 RepID=UPI003523721C